MKTSITALLVIIWALCMVACGGAPPISEAKTSTGCMVEDYGRGVFYFRCASGFGPALAEFRTAHDVVSVTSYSSYQYGTDGYWVVTR